MPWQPGDVIVRREVWHGSPWCGSTARVVLDEPELLVTYTPPGTPFAFPEGNWPGGRHPWHGRDVWSGHGTLALHRPHDRYAVFVFWEEPGRRFACWYVNFQDSFRRTTIGFDTLDHELDLVIEPDGTWWLKDIAGLELRVADGRFTPAEADEIRAEAATVAQALAAGERWWAESWARWEPPPAWTAAPMPAGWDAV
jgi:Protein of unknown function (DUF402)